MIVVYRQRDFSYDFDWIEAFSPYKPKFVDMDNESVAGEDLTIFMHSTNGQRTSFPEWCFKLKGPKALFLGNEFKQLDEKRRIAESLGAKIISQLTQEDATSLYGNAVSIPHGMSDYYKASDWKSRPRLLGFRGSDYARLTKERVAVLEAFKDYDVKGPRLPRKEWGRFLNECKGTPSTEAGIQHKCISSRHLEAVACKTVNIMPRGRFNDILLPEHYIELTTAKESLERLMDEGEEIANRAYEHCLQNHTLRHRIEKLLSLF